jgi:ABC-2 type transport system ATP-binding protein
MSGKEISLGVSDLEKRYAGAEDGQRAVDGVSFEIEEGQFYTLLGPSGCGKTTTLRCVAGLERTDAGPIVLGGRVVSSHSPKTFVRPDERDIGMVFQSYAIWPHMTVYENVAFPLRSATGKHRVRRSDIPDRVMEALETVQLKAFAERPATKLSGGQQQRLALYIATIHDPLLLLLDEPTSGLDPQSRRALWSRIEQLRTRGSSILLTTHSMEEAQAVCDRVAIIDHGKLLTVGTPADLIAKHRQDPRVLAVAHGDVTLEDVFIGLTGSSIRD